MSSSLKRIGLQATPVCFFCFTEYTCSNEANDVKACRVVTVQGNTTERGAQLWKLVGEDITQLANIRRQMYSHDGIQLWNRLGDICEPLWKKHAPVSWSEFQGMTEVHCQYKRDKIQRQKDLKLLGTDFEMQMSAWRNPSKLYNHYEDFSTSDDEANTKIEKGKCTAFAFINQNGSTLCGQNVDEDGTDWLEGSKDILLKLMSDNPSIIPHAMVYTHPGVPAYCGMNSSGLCLLNLYIDTPKKTAQQHDLNGGLPIDVTIRELLTHHTIQDALDWLQDLPRVCPTTYILLQGSTIACVELSEERMVTCLTKQSSHTGNSGMDRSIQVCHSNHPLFDELMFPDITKTKPTTVDGIGGQEESIDNSYSSINRLQYIRQQVNEIRNKETLDVDASKQGDHDVDEPRRYRIEAAKKLLSSCPAAHPTYAPTLASVLLDPQTLTMHIKFRHDSKWIEETLK